jgi:hypothetical protein
MAEDKPLTIAERAPSPFSPGVLLPKPQVNGVLTMEEESLLASLKAKPADYASVMLPSVATGMGFQPMPDGKLALMIQVMIMVPADLIPAEASAILDPKTQQPIIAQRLAKAIPEGWPALTRFLMRRNAFAKPIQDRLADADARQALAAAMFAKGGANG